MRTDEVAELLPYLTEDERAELTKLLAADKAIWRPLPGPQSMAYHSKADIIGYGGAAGGGKTDLACGLAVTQHTVSAIFRREGTQLTGVIDRLTGLLTGRDGYNGQERIWRLGSKQIEFGSVPHPGDETKYMGRPKDLLVLDEAANFLEAQVRFLMGWVRTTKPGQKCTTLMTFNPPTTAEGRWIISFFGPWLDSKHPNPATPGELRWFATIAGKDIELPDSRPFVLTDGERRYEFDRRRYTPQEIITPQSRTFIPSRLSDNPYLTGTGYMTQLQALPEPLRSQMLNGDFNAGMKDSAWQVIPTAWVEAAMQRWKPRDAKGPMDSMGVDVSRGGDDETVVSRRHGFWFDELLVHTGAETPNGPAAAGHVMVARRDRAPVHIDIIGIGSSAYDFLVSNDIHTVACNGAEGTDEKTKDDQLRFYNVRARDWWRMREALDPENPEPISLPLDSGLKADLCAPLFNVKPRGILVEPKERIIKRLGRSPDRGDAVVNANRHTRKRATTIDRFDINIGGIA